MLHYLQYILLPAFFLIGCVYTLLRRRQGRIFLAILAVLLVGFSTKSFISVHHISSVIRGTMRGGSALWLTSVMGAMTIATLVLGRVYCGWVCPFGGIMYLIYSVSPFKWVFNNGLHFRVAFLKYFLFLAGIIIFPAGMRLFSVEPFEHIFVSYRQTLLVALSCVFVGIAFVIPYFWCRYFCFLGGFWGIISHFSFLKYTVKCGGARCSWYARQCPTGAIREDGRIVQRECVRCNMCQTCKQGDGRETKGRPLTK